MIYLGTYLFIGLLCYLASVLFSTTEEEDKWGFDPVLDNILALAIIPAWPIVCFALVLAYMSQDNK